MVDRASTYGSTVTTCNTMALLFSAAGFPTFNPTLGQSANGCAQFWGVWCSKRQIVALRRYPYRSKRIWVWAPAVGSDPADRQSFGRHSTSPSLPEDRNPR